MRLIGDLETDGLIDTVTKIHCATFYDLDAKNFIIFMPDEVNRLPEFLSQVRELSFHNGLGYDLKVLKKLYGFEYKGKYRDTLCMSRILWPDIEHPTYTDEKGKTRTIKNKHSIAAWAVRFGMFKVENEDWSVFTENMLWRNRVDVEVAVKLWEHIQETIINYNKKDPRLNNFSKIFDMEHKFWKIAEEQAGFGWLFNVNLAFDLEKELEEKIERIGDQLKGVLPMRIISPYDKPCQAFKKDGSVTSHALSWIGIEREKEVGGDFTRIKIEPMNLDSSDQLKDFLLAHNWVAKEWNFKRDKHNKPVRDDNGKVILTSPKTPKTAEDWQEVEDNLKIPQISLLAERQKASHRLSSLRGWIEKLRPDQRLEAQMNTCGTNTARCMHRVIVNVPKSDPKVYYGEQFRSLFICPPGKLIMGCDATALEGRCESHYLYNFDKAAAWELLHGDIHTRNAEEVFKTTRNVAKNGKYALLYGCSPAKLATVIGKSIEEAKHIYDQYWKANPGLKHLVDALKRQWQKHKYLVSIDGRPLTIRYEHALLNTLLQSCGSIVVKKATCILYDKIKYENLDAFQIGHFHDEVNYECNKDVAKYVGELAVQSFKEAGEYYKLNCPIDAEYKIGGTWKEVH